MSNVCANLKPILMYVHVHPEKVNRINWYVRIDVNKMNLKTKIVFNKCANKCKFDGEYHFVLQFIWFDFELFESVMSSSFFSDLKIYSSVCSTQQVSWLERSISSYK